MKKALIFIAATLGFVIPSLVFAQSASTALLTVYVQVINQNPGFPALTPGNFQVSVTGQSPSPSTFAGSQQGTLVTLNPGSFTVTIVNPMNYTINYSTGCNNTLIAGQSHTCVITVSAPSYNWPFPSPYPYPQNPPALTCRTDTPTVALGQTARFTALGGAGGTYNWSTPTQNYPNVGPVLSIAFNQSGMQTVQVTNAAQTATCSVVVTPSYYPQPTPPVPTYPYPGPQVPPVLTVMPSFPNTGIEPQNGAALAFATVLLLGAAIAGYPYARKAFALAVR